MIPRMYSATLSLLDRLQGVGALLAALALLLAGSNGG